MKNSKILALLVSSIMSMTTSANIIISEYVEGSGSNKAIEISNIGSENVDLAPLGYKLSLYSNGATTANAEVELQGLLVPNSSIVIYNAGADAAFKKDAPQGIESSSVINFNGDDTIVLSNQDGTVDAFGQIGVRQQWSDSNGFNSKDKTLRRNASVTAGNTDANSDFATHLSEWSVFAKNTSDGLGCNGEQACDGSQPMPQDGTPVGGGSGGNNGGNNGGNTGICTNCPDLTKVADASAFDDTLYYQKTNSADQNDINAFRSAINQDINTVKHVLTYSEVWTALTYTDQDPANTDNLILIYSGKSIPKANNASGVNDPDFWNREHVWAKSHGFPDQDQEAYTDIHHLRPADASMNTTRSDNDFDNGGEAVSEAPENLINGDISFEPRDAVKGDVARMLFYMDVRYETGSVTNTPDLVLVDHTDTARTGMSDGKGELGKLCTLLTWSKNDPVDDFERARNNAVYEYQGNRNPFIDHPEWVDIVYKNACPELGVTIDAVADVNENTQVTLTAHGTGNNITYLWEQTQGTSVTLANTDQASISFTAPDVSSDTELTFKVTVTDENNNSQSAEVSFTVKNVPAPAPTPTPTPETNSSGGGSFGFAILFTLLALIRYRKRN